jgi:predicted aldo/keto reductase-like oxidoreductase
MQLLEGTLVKYRKFGKLDWKVSALGFGAMRLPIINGDASKINESEALKMMRYALDNGLNYVDTAYPYHRGNSEGFVGKALQEGYREKTRLATKMPSWLIKSQEDMDRYLDEQLSRLQLDHVDFYLLHGLRKDAWQKLKDLNVLRWAEKKMDEGKFLHLGFSFHDDYCTFKKIVDAYDGWTLCQIQYNYMDEQYQAGTRGLKYAASKGLAVVVMEPIAGGRLAAVPPKEIQEFWDKVGTKRTPADWALQWVWNHPEVSVVLSGMSTFQQVKENLGSADRSSVDKLTVKELSVIRQVRRKYKRLGFIGCTGCRYCMPCPRGVNVPEIFSLYNEYYIRNEDDEIKSKYWEHITPESQAKRCERCGKCEELCPQHLEIREILNRAAWIFEQKT